MRTALALPQHIGRPANMFECQGDVLMIASTVFRQADALMLAAKQSEAERRFKLLDAVTDRRLSHIEFQCGFGEACQPASGLENHQTIQRR